MMVINYSTYNRVKTEVFDSAYCGFGGPQYLILGCHTYYRLQLECEAMAAQSSLQEPLIEFLGLPIVVDPESAVRITVVKEPFQAMKQGFRRFGTPA